MSKVSLRRYTNLAATLDVLRNKRLTLLSPSTWDDRNDAYFMSAYKDKTNALSLLALCFAEAPETCHHWRVFSHGSDGVCIELDKEGLTDSLPDDRRIRYRAVTYRQINDLSANDVETNDLPFLKRFPYKDEREVRLVYIDMTESKEFGRVAKLVEIGRRGLRGDMVGWIRRRGQGRSVSGRGLASRRPGAW